MEMQCELLVSSFKEPQAIERMKENIRRVSDGSSPHCAGALKLGFEKASNLKKKPVGVLLRCPRTACPWYVNHVSYSTVGPDTYCTQCRKRGRIRSYLQCVGCGSDMTSNRTSCQKCGKKFL